DGINWQSIASYSEIVGGYPPGGISPAGEIISVTNMNPLGNPEYVTSLSTDAGLSFTTLDPGDGRIEQDKPGVYQTYYTINGRHVAFTNNPSFKAISCGDFVDDCPEYAVDEVVIDYLIGVPHYTVDGHAVVAGTVVYEIAGL
ncbi:MAG: hypothetical protein RJQ14_00850, partial [Marinoscillum sp.]